MQKKLLLVLNIFLIPFNLLSQNAELYGTVKDENNEVVSFVNVVVDASKGLATTTDLDGKFSIKLPAGKYTLTVSYIGYKKATKEVNLKTGEEKAIHFSLLKQEEVIDEIVVSGATRRGIIKEKEVVTIETLSADVIANNNITIASEAVDKVAGVTLLDGQASIRGGSGYAYGAGSRAIMVVDEIPLLSPERSEILWDFVPMENIKQIDVVKGASSVQYGSSALNGIISASTLWPKKKHETNVSIYNMMYGNPPIKEGKWWSYPTQYALNPHNAGIQFAHRRKVLEDMDLVFSAALISHQSHIKDQFNKRIRNNIKWRYMPKKISNLQFSLNSNFLYRHNKQFFIWENNHEGAYKGRGYEDKYIRYSIDPIIKYYFKNSQMISNSNRIYYDQRLEQGNRDDYISILSYNDLQYKNAFKNTEKKIQGSVVAGATNSFNKISSYAFKNFSIKNDGKFIFNTFSIYSQADFGWKGLTLAFGGRFDYVTFDTITAASKPVFNAGLSYKLPRKNYLRFSFGQSFRVPSLVERYVKEEITKINIGDTTLIAYALPNPQIIPEEGYSFELGYKKVFTFSKFSANIDFAIFYQHFKNMTEFTFGRYQNIEDTSKYDLGFKMLNIAKARIFGWEATIAASNKFKKVTLNYRFGYTYNYAANAEEDPTLNNFFKVISNAFKAYHISKDDYVDYYQNNKKNIIHGMLRYRFRHTFKSDINLDSRWISIGTNIRYYSFIDRVDAVFAQFIPGIKEFRDSKNYKGDWIFDIRAFFHANEHISIGFIVKNLFNRNYQLRPAKPEAPRNFTAEVKFNF